MKKGKREQGERKAIGDVSEQLSTVIDMALLGLPRFSSLIRFLNHLSSLPLAWFFYFRFIVREITTWTVFQKRWSFPVSFCAWAFFFRFLFLAQTTWPLRPWPFGSTISTFTPSRNEMFYVVEEICLNSDSRCSFVVVSVCRMDWIKPWWFFPLIEIALAIVGKLMFWIRLLSVLLVHTEWNVAVKQYIYTKLVSWLSPA